ncbi:MAG: DUF2380 domain-containing protein [Rhodobacteraceae bacterium]|nr:MAG: DUF2380 domain-containing protein [Paracoccaceae bacterium]
MNRKSGYGPTGALVAICLALAPLAAVADDLWTGKSAAFFGVSFLDTSTEGAVKGARTDEAERIDLVRTYIAERFIAGGLELVDLAPVQEELDRTLNPAKCNGCELRMAKRLGADYAIVSEVQKVSNLILSMNIQVRDPETGRNLRASSVEIRGNTDDSWLRGMRYILERAIFRDG